MAKGTPARDLAAELAFCSRALKAPTLREAVGRLAERARARAGATRSSSLACRHERSPLGSPTVGSRIRSARFPARKSLEDFDFDHPGAQARHHRPPRDARLRRRQGQRRVPRPTGDRQDPSGHGSGDPGLSGRAPGGLRHRGRVGGPPRRGPHQGNLHAELTRLGRIPLLVIDEVGYIPFDGEAANLFFQLISARYERASVIVTSNKPFGRWGEVFGDRWWPGP